MEEQMTTRKKIIYESLRLFSEKGYDGVSMREIAAAVGIKGASIYNHFRGKEDLFQAIFQEMTKHYDDFARGMALPMEQGQEAVEAYLSMGESQMMQSAEMIFSFFTQDRFVVMFRRLLMSEQNKSPIAAKCLKDYYIDAPPAVSDGDTGRNAAKRGISRSRCRHHGTAFLQSDFLYPVPV